MHGISYRPWWHTRGHLSDYASCRPCDEEDAASVVAKLINGDEDAARPVKPAQYRDEFINIANEEGVVYSDSYKDGDERSHIQQRVSVQQCMQLGKGEKHAQTSHESKSAGWRVQERRGTQGMHETVRART